jgi:molybdopterin molybdotransferase
LIPLEEAQARVIGACTPLPPTVVALDDALGLVLAEEVVADQLVPPFANTAMDGFALRASDTDGAPVRLRVVGDLAAGADPAGVVVGPGEAVRIMTGAAIPDGADAVVMVERTSTADDEVTVEVTVPPGNHVRPAGEDLSPGQLVFEPGDVLSAGHLGVLATLGRTEVAVVPRPRVGVLSTGDELVEGPGQLRPGQIRDANRHSLLALVQEAGCEPVDLGIAPDDESAIEGALDSGLESCDALVTSGGVSMGDYDYVKAVLERRAAGAGGRGSDAMTWMQVAIKPAKPLSFGVVDGKPVFGLPGNPASSMVSFELFARPALRLMAGHSELHRPQVSAVAGEDFRRGPDGKLHLVRVVAEWGPDGRLHVRSAGGQASNLLRSMAASNGLALVPDGEGVRAGQEVKVLVVGTLAR